MLSGRACIVSSRVVTMGDTIAFTTHDGCICFGQLYFTCSVDGSLYSCISKWLVQEVKGDTVYCLVQEAPSMYATSCVLESCTFFKAPAGSVSHVLLPPKLRLSGVKVA